MQLAFFFMPFFFFSNFVFCSSIKPALEPLKNAKIFTPLCKSDTTKCATVIWNWEFHSEIIWLNQDIFWNLNTLWFVNDSVGKTWRELVEYIINKFILVEFNLCTTGGPPLKQKSLTRFPLPQFLAYVRASGRCNTVFSKSQNAHKAGTLCTQLVWISAFA